MNISDRIIQYLESKAISKNKFYIQTGLSNGFLDKKPNIGADKIEIIYSNYPDINVEWLITGEGEMLKTGKELSDKVEEDKVLYGKITSDKDIESKLTELQSSLREKELLLTEAHARTDELRGQVEYFRKLYEETLEKLYSSKN
jgi:hypothetical protein